MPARLMADTRQDRYIPDVLFGVLSRPGGIAWQGPISQGEPLHDLAMPPGH